MKVIIAGGRDFDNGSMVIEAVRQWKIKHGMITEIVSGMAKGADMMGLNYGRIWEIHVKEFPADWKTHGNSAGYKRNAEMANYAEGLIAFWDGQSKGTKMMIDIATKKGLKVEVFNY